MEQSLPLGVVEQLGVRTTSLPIFRLPKEAERNVVNASTVLSGTAALLLTAACSKQAEQISSATEQATDALSSTVAIDASLVL